MEDTILLEEGDTLELVTGHVTTGKASRLCSLYLNIKKDDRGNMSTCVSVHYVLPQKVKRESQAQCSQGKMRPKTTDFPVYLNAFWTGMCTVEMWSWFPGVFWRISPSVSFILLHLIWCQATDKQNKDVFISVNIFYFCDAIVRLKVNSTLK